MFTPAGSCKAQEWLVLGVDSLSLEESISGWRSTGCEAGPSTELRMAEGELDGKSDSMMRKYSASLEDIPG